MAQTATLTSTATIAWSDGATFDGYLVFLIVVPPTYQMTGPNGEVISKSPTLAKASPQQFCPLWEVIPIRNGVLPSNCKILRTDALNPRGCQYRVFLFDSSWTQLTGVSGISTSTFAVTGDLALTIGAVPAGASVGAITQFQLVNNPYTVGSGSGSVYPSQIYTFTQTVTAAAPNVGYSVLPANTVLLMVLTADGSGTMPVFGAEFQDVNASDFNSSSGARSTFIFYSTGTLWQALSTRSIV